MGAVRCCEMETDGDGALDGNNSSQWGAAQPAEHCAIRVQLLRRWAAAPHCELFPPGAQHKSGFVRRGFGAAAVLAPRTC